MPASALLSLNILDSPAIRTLETHAAHLAVVVSTAKPVSDASAIISPIEILTVTVIFRSVQHPIHVGNIS